MDSFFVIIVLLTVLALVIVFPILWYFDSFWSKGEIPPFYKYSRNNELEIIIALAGNFVRRDFRDVSEKKNYLESYFIENFKKETYDFGASFKNSYKSPLKIEAISNWFNKHLKDEATKLNIVQLMINICMLDGELVGKEYSTLKNLHLQLKLPLIEFDRIIAIHLQRNEEEQKRRENTHSFYKKSRESILNDCFVILGIEATKDEKSIKKAYRNLAKKYHPDLLINASPLQQKLANERFLEIQKAYDSIVEMN